MENKTKRSSERVREIIDELFSEYDIKPEELAEIIFLGFTENAGHRIFGNKSVYYTVMRVIYLRCANAGKTFDEWIISNQWEIA